MPIVAVKAISHKEMSDYLDDMPGITRSFVKGRNVWIVSIVNPDMDSLVEGQDNVLSLKFWDTDPTTNGLTALPDDPMFFNNTQADQVVAFLNTVHTSPTDDVLLINCMAGVSRSGAVADFARTLFQLDYDGFKRVNPRIVPNVWVRQQLGMAAGRTITTPKTD